MNSRWLTLGVRPPADRANRVDVLRFLRDLMVRSLLVSVVLGAVVALTALDALFLTWQLRRAERE